MSIYLSIYLSLCIIYAYMYIYIYMYREREREGERESRLGSRSGSAPCPGRPRPPYASGSRRCLGNFASLDLMFVCALFECLRGFFVSANLRNMLL